MNGTSLKLHYFSYR